MALVFVMAVLIFAGKMYSMIRVPLIIVVIFVCLSVCLSICLSYTSHTFR